MADKPKDDKPKIDFELISSRLKDHAEGEHIDEITERLSNVYLSHKKSVGNKRKLDIGQAEKLGHQIYDELINYVTEYYKMSPEEAKALKGKKGKHGELMLDTLVEHAFKINRAALIKNLKNNADAGKTFSNKYIQQIMDKSIENYGNHVQGQIIRDLNEEHIEDIRKQIEMYIGKHKLDKDKFKGVMKSKNFDEVLGTYAQLASNYYTKPEAPAKPGK